MDWVSWIIVSLLFGCYYWRWLETTIIGRNRTVAQIDSLGNVIQKWEHVTVLASNNGWVRFRTEKGDIVLLDYPHIVTRYK